MNNTNQKENSHQLESENIKLKAEIEELKKHAVENFDSLLENHQEILRQKKSLEQENSQLKQVVERVKQYRIAAWQKIQLAQDSNIAAINLVDVEKQKAWIEALTEILGDSK